MTRQEYLDNYHGGDEGAQLHRRYYAQFVTDATRDLVKRFIGEEAVKASKDPHFNDIALKRWDTLVGCIPGVEKALRAHGDFLSLGTGVCILKEAAQQIREAV
jgi:hypothetical protein